MFKLNETDITKAKKYFGVIYKVTNNVNNKIYIGQTKDILSRIRQYRYESKKRLNTSRLITTDLFKYKLDAFSIEIIDYCKNIDDLNTKEKYWIESYNSTEPNGYNTENGGGGYINRPGRKISHDEKQKKSHPIIAYKDNTYEYFYSAKVFGDIISAPRTNVTRAIKNGGIVRGYHVFYAEPDKMKHTLVKIILKYENSINKQKSVYEHIQLAKNILDGSVEIIEPYLIEINI